MKRKLNYGYEVEADYFSWLCDTVHIDQEDSSYLNLAKDLHHHIFYGIIPHDENRASDGEELREYYLREVNYPKYVTIDGECSMLEMLIALARRMSFETSDPYGSDGSDKTTYWFWEMIDNLDLIKFSDDYYYDAGGEEEVDRIIDRFLQRGYSEDGRGGLFPLEAPLCDQRGVEIWYQMNCYIAEKE